MVHNPYVLTIPSSGFTGTTTATIDLGGKYRNVQIARYYSSDAVVLSNLTVGITKTESINIPQYAPSGAYESVLATGQDISALGVLYLPVVASFFRYVKFTVTGQSCNFTAGTAYVSFSFDGCEWSSS